VGVEGFFWHFIFHFLYIVFLFFREHAVEM
jgi:hypothetical protein